MDSPPDVETVGDWVVPELEHLRKWQQRYLRREETAKRALWAIVKHRHHFNDKCFMEVSIAEINAEMCIIYHEMHSELIKDPEQFKERVLEHGEANRAGPYHRNNG